MTALYSRVPVGVSVWGDDAAPDDPTDEFEGRLEEMYVDGGSLVIIFVHEDGNTVTDVQIPIQAKQSWNELVESMPTWDV